MLASAIFIVLAGLIVGGLMARNSVGEQGWILLTGPMTALLVGLPTSIIFAYVLPQLPDPSFGLWGAWRAIVVGAVLGLSAGILLNHLSRNPRRRRDAFELAGPLILFALVGVTLGLAWGAVHVFAA